MDDILSRAYDPESFRERGHQLVDDLANHMKEALAGEGRAFSWKTPEEALQQWQFNPDTPDEEVNKMLETVLRESIHLHHPNYMGHQISPPVPVGTLAGLLGDFLNNGMGVYEMGIPGTAIEVVVVRALAKQMGFGPEADGILTSGGTLANLTAMLAARSIRAKANVWQDGNTRPMALMVSEEAHYCVDRTARIMGWGEAGIIKIPVNDRFQMRTELLEEYYQNAVAQGIEVIAVVGSACSTSTGSFDDLEAIAAFCARHDLWFHVDGAHGGASVFSQKYRHLVRCIEQADSVVMDFHKMLMTPSVTTALVFKNGAHSYQTFSQKAQYLFQAAEPEWFNLARRTFECTKLMIGLKAYAIWRTYGTALFDAFVTRMYDLGATFAGLIRNHPNFELAVEPECNIVCFRYLGPGDVEANNARNAQIRQAIVQEGHYYIVQTQLRGQTWLRVTLVNPNTDAAVLKELMVKIEGTLKPE